MAVGPRIFFRLYIRVEKIDPNMAPNTAIYDTKFGGCP